MTAYNPVTVRNSLPAGQQTDNAALAECMKDTSTSLEIFLPEGQGTYPDGAYNISVSPFAPSAADPSQPNPNIPSHGNITRGNVRIYGNGKFRTIVRQPLSPDQPIFMAHVDPNTPQNLLTSIQIDNMTLIGNTISNPGPYNEQNNLIFVGGANGFKVQLVEFREFEGDRLYMGSPTQAFLVHNFDLQVIDCLFDGANKRNRNCISLLDCTNWSVTGTSFVNCCDFARNTPGAIDIEPELSGSVIKNGTVKDCYFGNVGAFALTILNAFNNCETLTFSQCNITEAARGVLQVFGFRGLTASNLYADGKVGSSATGMIHPFVIGNSESVTIRDSNFRNGDQCFVGRLGGAFSKDTIIQSNSFYRCGKDNGPVISQ